MEQPKQSQSAKEQIEAYMKTLLKSKEAGKREFLRGKSIIYKQHNFQSHSQPDKELRKRFNPFLDDLMNRGDLKDAVERLSLTTALRSKTS